MQMLPNPGTGGNDPRNLIILMVVFMLTVVGYNYYAASQRPEVQQEETAKTETPAATASASLAPTPLQTASVATPQMPAAVKGTNVPKGQVFSLKNEFYHAGVDQRGGRLDHLTLPTLQDKLHKEGDTWFSPTGEHPQYLDTGWLGTGVLTPAPDAVWQMAGQTERELRLVWTNNQGQVFERIFTLQDDRYMVTVTDRVSNQTDVPVSLQHYAQVVRGGGNYKGEQSTWMNYFGPIGLVEGVLVEESYKDVAKNSVMKEGRGGWWGISTQYFLTAIGTSADTETVRRFNYTKQQNKEIYTAVVQNHPATVQPNGTLEVKTDVYIGPKSVKAVANAGYALDRAVDYGWLSALAKPMYHVLLWLHSVLGNWGLAIIGLTICLKILTFPLTYKSFAAMAKLKKLQPEMKAMQEKYKDNREQMATAMMTLYKEQKVSPLSGCWPVLVQMPIFFAMYKVMLISFEFRGAPFFGWITDLSLQDPYYVLPLLMGASMWVQMQLNPQAGDPIQQQVMKILPIVFTVFFLFFPSGLVLYWLTNNLISIAQQWFMLKREGVR